MKNFASLLISVCLLSACASIPPAQVDTKLSAWRGAEIQSVIQVWGLPSSEREIQGVKYAEWNSREIKRRPAVNIGIGGFGGHIFGSIGTTIFGGNKETHCLVQLGYDANGFVISSNWQGDPATCDEAIPERL